jgi:maltoporin
MRRVLQLSGLSGLLVTGFFSTHAFAQQATSADAEQPGEEQKESPKEGPKAEPAAPIVPAAAVASAEAVVAPAAKPKVGDMTTSGYFRGGFGASNKKGRMTCFQLANPDGLISKYRLGNECEVWAEMEFTTVVYAGEDGSVARMHFMPVAFIPTTYIGYSPNGSTSSDQGSPGTGATVAFPNLYTDIKGISWLFGGTAWAGTRYYKRESVYISDFFYWNPSGVGAGIEDVTLGKIWDSAPDMVKDMTFSWGAFAVDGQTQGIPPLPPMVDFGVRNDLQLRGFRPYEGGELQIGFQHIFDYSNDKDTNGVSNTHGGWGVTVRHVQQVLGGDNKLAFQYGKGGGTGFGTLARFYYPDFSLRWDPKQSRLRVVDVLTIQPTDWFGAQANFVYQKDDKGTGNTDAQTTWISAGGRVSFGVTEHLKLLYEEGFDRAKKSNGAETQWLLKTTGAVAIAGNKGFWGRPELRLFYTYGRWSKAAAGATVDSGKLYTYADPITGAYTLSGSIFGMQAEAMW